MGLRLLLDEDTKSRRLVLALRAAGHDVVTTADMGLDGEPDDSVLRTAIVDNRIVLTQNCHDFLMLHHRLGQHCGLLLIYPHSLPSRQMTVEQIVRALKNLEAAGVSLASAYFALNDWNF